MQWCMHLLTFSEYPSDLPFHLAVVYSVSHFVAKNDIQDIFHNYFPVIRYILLIST